MTKKQKLAIALMCALALLLAGLMLWRQPVTDTAPQPDPHGHDERRADNDADADANAGVGGIALTEAQIRANGIALDKAVAATLRQRLHLPAQVKVDAERTVALAAPAPGIVQTVHVSPGAVVRQGQALVTLRSPAVAQWRAEAQAALRRLQLARTTHEREKTLWDERISARQDLEAAATALQEADIAAQAAAQRLRALGIDGGAVSGSVTVRAPFAGVVIEKPAVAGQAVDETKPLLTLADLAHVWVEAAVPVESLGQVGTGMAAKISVGTLPDEIDGTVSFVDPILGATTRMATARITLPNRDGRLRPGMLASVDLMGPQAQVPVTVATEAIQTIHEHSVVFVRTQAGFEARDVVPGRSDGRRTEIVRGLAAGTTHAAGGSFLLKADLGKSAAGHDD